MRIGIISPWFERGLAYVALMMYQALSEIHEVHVLAQPSSIEPVGEEWRIENLTRATKESFRESSYWAESLDLDLLILNESYDPGPGFQNLRKKGMKILSLTEWESFDPHEVSQVNRLLDGLIAPTQNSGNYLRSLGVKRVFDVPWGVDLRIFGPGIKASSPFVSFFHPAGYGGVGGRRSTTETIEAYTAVSPRNSQLQVLSQRPGNPLHEDRIHIRHGTLSRIDLAAYYGFADVCILPSKWEGIGLTFLEALASGCAIITVDSVPMNSYVRHGWNGHLVSRILQDPGIPDIHILAAHVSMSALEDSIRWVAEHPEEVKEMGRHSRQWAIEEYDWAKRSRRLLEVVEGI